MSTRRLAAILAADVAGFSAMMERDEEGTAARIRALRGEVIEPLLAKHHGRLVKTTGDGFHAEFASPVEAVRSALAIQDQLAAAEMDNGLRLRIGINLGDIIIEEDGDVFGDGVNVAARLEQRAEPGGICVSDEVHRHVAGKIDRSFEDRGEQQVKNISRPVRVYALAESTSPKPEFKPLPLPDKPSIAVLPFTNMSGDPEQEYFADGVVEDIITALSRVKWLFVIARNSSFTYKGRAVDVKVVGRELGVRYVLEGSIRKAGNRVRITGQLIDAATRSHLWADRIGGELADVFDLQDKITEGVVADLQPSLRAAEMERARQKVPGSLDAHDLYLRALHQFYLYTPESFESAIKLTDEALTIDPEYAMAASLGSLTRGYRIASGWSPDPRRDTAEALRLAELALAIDRDNPEALAWAGRVKAWGDRDFGVAKEMVDKAVSIDPNSALAWGQRGWTYHYSDLPEEAIVSFNRAMRLDPRDPMLWATLTGIALAQAKLGRYEEAIATASRARTQNPKFSTIDRCLVSCFAHLGNVNDAQAAARRMLALEPHFSISEWYVRSGTGWSAAMVDGLRKAGLPE